MKKPKLNIRQEKFVSAYLKHGNATQAAIDAGYSDKTAHSAGPRLLDNVEVAQAIEDGRQRLSEKLDITPERVLRRLSEWGFADPRQMFDELGNLRHPKDMPDELAVAISEVEVTKRASGEALHKIKRVDPLGAMNTIAKVLGMVRDKVDVTVSGDLASKLDAARKRRG